MSCFYDTANCQVALSFVDRDNSVSDGLILPLEVIGTKEACERLDSVLQKLQSEAVIVSGVIIRTNNFFVPGIGTGRSFQLIFGQEDEKPPTNDSTVNFSQLADLLRGIRNHGRPLTGKLVDLWDRNEAWSKLSSTHLLRCVTHLPHFDDPAFTVNKSGLFPCEEVSADSPFGVNFSFHMDIEDHRLCHEKSDYVIVEGVDKKSSVHNQSHLNVESIPSADPFGLQFSLEPLVSDTYLSQGLTATDVCAENAASNKTFPKEELEPKSVDMKTVPIVHKSFLTDVSALKAVLHKDTPTPVLERLLDKNFQALQNERGQPQMNPEFLVLIMEWCGLPIDDICQQWYTEYYGDEIKLEISLPLIINEFLDCYDDRRLAVFKFYLLYHPTEEPLGLCDLCRVPGVHLVINCPLFYTFAQRQERLKYFNICTGCCEPDCRYGRKPHLWFVMLCSYCKSESHVSETCDDDLFWKSPDRLVTRRVQYIIAVCRTILCDRTLLKCYDDVVVARNKFLNK